MKFKKYRFLFICLCVVLCLAIVSGTLAAMGQASVLGNVVNVVATPFRRVFGVVGDGFAGLGDYFTKFHALQDENAALAGENARLKESEEEARVLREENEWLRRFLNIRTQNPTYEMTDARVTSRSATTNARVLTLNKGSLQGIRAGMAVLDGDGNVVGQTADVGLTFCKVVCITDLSSAVGGVVETSGVTGLVEGYFSGKVDTLCRFVNTNADPTAKDTEKEEQPDGTDGTDDADSVIDAPKILRVGDRVVTSGTGSVYPYGLTIGRVSAVSVDGASRSVVGTIEAAADFERLSRVMVLLNFEKTTEDSP